MRPVPPPARRTAAATVAALALALVTPPSAADGCEPVCASPTLRSVSRTPVVGVVAGVQDRRPAAVAYHPPVAAPVSDPFRPPATPYGPGNRGLEYAVTPGTEVSAAAAGTVTFAGSVAGALHVTVRHADRARTTYAGLAGVTVVEGEAVAAGQVVGTAAATLLWTVRLGEAYLDPAVVLAASGRPGVRLVPVREGLGGG